MLNHLSIEFYTANPHDDLSARGRRSPWGLTWRDGKTVFLIATLLLLSACGGEHQEPEPNDVLPHELNNRGVALMGRFDYVKAADTFAKVVETAPNWSEAKINLAIATLNRQNPGDEDAALSLLSPIVSSGESDTLRARASFTSGILHFNRGNTELAQEMFAQAAELAPDDAYTQYFLGQTLLQQGNAELALENFQRAGQLDDYLRSAFYGQFLALQRLGQREAAREMLGIYERLENNPRSKLAEIKYTRMGPLAMANASLTDGVKDSVALLPAGPLFADATVLSANLSPDSASARVQVTSNTLDTAITVITANSLQRCSLAGCSALDSPISHPKASAWGDMDNSGAADQLLLGPEQGLWVQYQGETQWNQVLAADAGLSGGRWDNLSLTDADHDGDLDVLLFGVNEGTLLIGNNGNRSYRRLNDFMPSMIAAHQVISVDLDQDRDLDLVLVLSLIHI